MTTTQPTRQYTSAEVIALTGCTYRQLDYWARLGLLTDTAHGSGSSRRFTFADVEAIYNAVRLIRVGFTAQAAVRIATALVDDGAFATSDDGLRIDMSYTPITEEQNA